MIRILTDSMSDLTQEEARALNIEVLPLTVRFGNEEYRDGVDMTLDEFYNKLVTVTELPKTSQVTPEAFLNAYDRSLAQGDEVLCITGSSKLSGTHQSAMMAKDMCSQPDRITVVDSRSASLGEALLVKLALVKRAEMHTAAELAAYIDEVKNRLHLVGQADELKYLVMGGRLSSIGAKLGTVLSIKPVLKLSHGKLVQAGLCRGSSKVRAWYIDQLREFPADTDIPLMLAGAHCDQTVSLLKQSVEASGLPLPPIITMQIGTVIGTHGGPGLNAMCWIAKA